MCYLVAIMFSRSRRDEGEMRLDEKRAILMFISIIIFSTIGLYSLFFVPIRSAFPLAPLYGVCLAVFLSNLVNKRAQIVDSS